MSVDGTGKHSSKVAIGARTTVRLSIEGCLGAIVTINSTKLYKNL